MLLVGVTSPLTTSVFTNVSSSVCVFVSAFVTQSLRSCGRFIKTMWPARPFVVFPFFSFGIQADLSCEFFCIRIRIRFDDSNSISSSLTPHVAPS